MQQSDDQRPVIRQSRCSWVVPVLGGITLAGAITAGVCFYKAALIIQPMVSWVSFFGLSPSSLGFLAAGGVAGIVLVALGLAFLIQHAATRPAAVTRL